MHIQAVSVSCPIWLPLQYGVDQSPGHPLHADGTIRGSPVLGGSVPSSVTPCGSPGFTPGGPTLPGAAVTGSFPFGSSGSGGRIERVKSPTTSVTLARPRLDGYLIAGTGVGRCAAPTAQTTAFTRCVADDDVTTKPAIVVLTCVTASVSSMSFVGLFASWTSCPVTTRSRRSASPTRVCVATAARGLGAISDGTRSSIDAPTSSSRTG